MIRYAGIGSRETPVPELIKIRALGQSYARQGMLLRSGGARGADNAFESGCDLEGGPKEIFTPEMASYDAIIMASLFHTKWEGMPDGIQALLARNCMVILGGDLKTPVDLVVCWTPNGEEIGGTGHALRIARHHGISIVNLGSPKEEKAKLEFFGI
jgi:hypothetical protein